ncbi:hypothetical protein BaRGS_00005894 [Batillaria attramentaria]|uniref:Uncharacterized protein n=1 Tax=Batillaria attramentaria TaxID=370345 RepID=A0ABD0LTU5_9CAEN
MWLPIVICLLSSLPVAMGYQLPDQTRHRQYPPLSLDDCLHLVTNQLSGWKSAYSDCISMYLSHVTQSPLFSQSTPVTNVALTTGDRHLDSEEGSTEVSALYSVKRSVQKRVTSQDSGHDYGTFRDDLGKTGTGGNGSDVNGTPKRDQEGTRPGWMSVFRRALLQVRKRRRHSLSINRALVSLADMLLSHDYGHSRSRQTAFRQHLSSIGR